MLWQIQYIESEYGIVLFALKFNIFKFIQKVQWGNHLKNMKLRLNEYYWNIKNKYFSPKVFFRARQSYFHSRKWFLNAIWKHCAAVICCVPRLTLALSDILTDKFLATVSRNQKLPLKTGRMQWLCTTGLKWYFCCFF